MEPILTKRQISMISALRHRHERKNSEFCLCDGLRACSEVIQLRPDLLELIVLRQGVELPLEPPVVPVVLPPAEFDKLAQTVHSQGIITVSRRPQQPPPDSPVKDPFALVLDCVRDPGNFGTMIRTARAAGLRQVFLTKGCADAFSDKCIRSASGAQFALDIRMYENLESLAVQLRKLGIGKFYRTLPAGGRNLFTEPGVFEHSAVIFGCESTGVSELENSLALHIPMPGDAESLNVAQAATIILFDYVRRITGG